MTNTSIEFAHSDQNSFDLTDNKDIVDKEQCEVILHTQNLQSKQSRHQHTFWQRNQYMVT